MDIDTPPAGLDSHHGHTHLELPEFSASFPLPFRVLFLIGFAILLWATNLQILHYLGLDTAWILDFRDPDLPSPTHTHERARADEYELNGESDGRGGTSITLDEPIQRPESGKLHAPVYKLAVLYGLWVGGGWVVYQWITGAEAEEMEKWRGLVGVVMVGAVLAAVLPWRGVGERERRGLRKSLRRILLPSPSTPIYFSDVIFADILTSFAKVLGDLYVSSSQIWNGGITHGRVRQYGLSNWITLSMVCLPYALRFRQCIFEAYQSRWASSRPLLNAMKYFSAFPVILLSAAQKTLVEEIAQSQGKTAEEIGDTRWHGEHRLFRLWLLAVVVNSMFSFYWDVQMDWGLRLCQLDTWFPKRAPANHPYSTPPRHRPTLLGKVKKLVTGGNGRSDSHNRSPLPTPSSSTTSLHTQPLGSPSPQQPVTAFGLRSTLLLPDPLVYHLFTLIDVVLRFTWSLKLSSHLHTISEIESGVFLMESLEILRRWMWIFIRIEWEAVKMGEGIRSGLGLGSGSGAGAGGTAGQGALALGDVPTLVWEK